VTVRIQREDFEVHAEIAGPRIAGAREIAFFPTTTTGG
jgi:hypothetical protein